MSVTIPFRFLTKKEVCHILGISRATLERLAAEERFPKRCKVSNRAVRWRSDEIDTYINNLPREEDAYACRNKKSRM